MSRVARIWRRPVDVLSSSRSVVRAAPVDVPEVGLRFGARSDFERDLPPRSASDDSSDSGATYNLGDDRRISGTEISRSSETISLSVFGPEVSSLRSAIFDAGTHQETHHRRSSQGGVTTIQPIIQTVRERVEFSFSPIGGALDLSPFRTLVSYHYEEEDLYTPKTWRLDGETSNSFQNTSISGWGPISDRNYTPVPTVQDSPSDPLYSENALVHNWPTYFLYIYYTGVWSGWPDNQTTEDHFIRDDPLPQPDYSYTLERHETRHRRPVKEEIGPQEYTNFWGQTYTGTLYHLTLFLDEDRRTRHGAYGITRTNTQEEEDNLSTWVSEWQSWFTQMHDLLTGSPVFSGPYEVDSETHEPVPPPEEEP